MTMFPEGSQPVLRVPTPPTEVPVQSFSVHTALCSLLVKDCGQPRSLLNGAFNYTTREGVNTYEARIQYCCHEPFYKMHTKDGTSESERGRDTCKRLSSPSRWNICNFFQQSLQGGNIKIFIPGTGFRGAKRLLIRLKMETHELIERKT